MHDNWKVAGGGAPTLLSYLRKRKSLHQRGRTAGSVDRSSKEEELRYFPFTGAEEGKKRRRKEKSSLARGEKPLFSGYRRGGE